MLPFYVESDHPLEDDLPARLRDLIQAQGSRDLIDAWPGDRDWLVGLPESRRRAAVQAARNMAIKLLDAPQTEATTSRLLWIRSHAEPQPSDELATAAIEVAPLLLGEPAAELGLLAILPDGSGVASVGPGGAATDPMSLPENVFEYGRPRLTLLDAHFLRHVAEGPGWLRELAELLETGTVLTGTGAGPAERDLECLALESAGARGPRWKNLGFGWCFAPQQLEAPDASALWRLVEFASHRKYLGGSLVGAAGSLVYVGDTLLLAGYADQAIDMGTAQLVRIVRAQTSSGLDIEREGRIAHMPPLSELERWRPARLAQLVGMAFEGACYDMERPLDFVGGLPAPVAVEAVEA